MTYHRKQPNRRPNGNQMLTISVKNFGPIAEGSVDLKPLTIFVGPSNTGKSYMATAVYAVMRAVEGRPQVPYTRHLSRRGIPVSINNPWKASDEVADAVREWVSQQEGKTWDPEEELPVSAMPQQIKVALADSTRQVLQVLRDDVIKQLAYGFGETSRLVNRRIGRENFMLVIHRDDPLLKLPIGTMESAYADLDFDISQALIPTNEIENWGSDYHKDLEIFPGLYHEFFFLSRILAAEFALGEFPLGSYYLPAARSGVVQARKFLASSIIRHSSNPESSRLSISGLPGVTTEFLSDLVSLDQGITPPKAELSKAISFIERNVLQGEVELDETDGLPYPEIAYETAAGKFTLNQTSSMVTELAPVVLFLKYLVRPGDLLILEEPESHLHPAAQLQLARGIARLVNAGVQVLITTHSGDFMGQIDNLLRMSNSREDTARSLGLEQEDCLSPEQVSAYGFRFDPDLGGAVTYPLPVGSDVGIEDEEFLPVAELLYHQALDLEDARLT